ncbi:MAG: STAS domain-containing protein [Anaerolineae bacterium]
MLIQTTLREDRGVAALEGSFDFNAHKEFRRACDTLLDEPAVRVLELDLARVQYLDSSALGMLLILRDKAEERGKQVILSGARGTVRQVLEIVNFGKLFTLRD